MGSRPQLERFKQPIMHDDIVYDTEKPRVKAAVKRIKEIREMHRCSLQQAYLFVMQEALETAIDNAESIDDLKAILRTITERCMR